MKDSRAHLKSMQPKVYPYEPIPSGDFFRHLVLQPGVGEEQLKCTLHTAIISETDFEALSYVWGDSTRNHTIQCGKHLMSITSSLSKVLRRIRRPDAQLSLWADGICINQDNLQEKGHQVGLMAKIYRAAQRVLIYIGPGDNGQGPAVCSLLNEVDEMITETSKTVDMSWDSFPYPAEDHPLLTDPRWSVLHDLLAQDWFDRGWVVQEAALASKSEVFWGESRIDWDKLMRVHIWLATRALGTYNSFVFSAVLINAHKNIYLDTHEDFGRAFHDEDAWGSPSILQTLNNAKELDLSNPQDRIYAFLELPQHLDHRVRIKPNYYKTHLDTFRQFAIQYIEATHSVELLDYVSHDETSPFDIPSWIPRWDISIWSLGQMSAASSVSRSRSGTVSTPVYMEDGSLEVHGVIIDTVHYVSESFDWDDTTPETIRDIWAQIIESPVPCPYVESSETDYLLLEAFFVALSTFMHDGEISEWRQARKEFVSQAHLDLPKATRIGTAPAIVDIDPSTDTTSGATNLSNAFFDFIRNRTHNRRFVLTERGYMGLAPAITRESDDIGIIFGCKTPCVLRRTDKEQYYTYNGAIPLAGKDSYQVEGGGITFCDVLGEDESREWVDWDVEEHDIYLC